MLIPEVKGTLSENAVKTAAHTNVSPSPLPETLAVKMEGSLKVGTDIGGTAKQNEDRSNLMFHTQSAGRVTSGRVKTENWQKLNNSDWGAPCIARSCSLPRGRWLWWAAAACSERMVRPCTQQCPPWPTSSARLKMLKKTGECSTSCTGWVPVLPRVTLFCGKVVDCQTARVWKKLNYLSFCVCVWLFCFVSFLLYQFWRKRFSGNCACLLSVFVFLQMSVCFSITKYALLCHLYEAIFWFTLK